MTHNLLLVEDDIDFGGLLEEYLIHSGFSVTWIIEGDAVWQAVITQSFDLVLLDVMIPKEDGFSIASKLHLLYPDLPFLFITARKMKADVIHGLKLGADDYIVKPFDPDEFILRVTNILKRRQQPEQRSLNTIVLGRYHFLPNDLLLTTPEQSFTLTSKEAELLKYLYNNRGQLIKRGNILNDLWQNADFFNGRSMDVYITRLRKLLSDDPAIEISSIRGVGYRFTIPDR